MFLQKKKKGWLVNSRKQTKVLDDACSHLPIFSLNYRIDLTSNNFHLIVRLPCPTFWILILLISFVLKWKGFLHQMRVIHNIGLFPYSMYFIYFVFFVLKNKSSIISHAIFWIPFFRGMLNSYIFCVKFQNIIFLWNSWCRYIWSSNFANIVFVKILNKN